MKKAAVVVILLAAVLLGAWYLRRARPAVGAAVRNAGAAEYMAVAEKRDIDFTIEVNGDVAPDFQLDVRPEVGGKVKKIYVEPGQTVNTGDPLIEIDDTDLLTQRKGALTDIEGAQLAVDKTARNFKRAQELFAAKLISQEVFDNSSSDFELAKNSFAKAQRALETVDDRLRKTKLFASANGTVLDVKVIEGQVVIPAASVNSGTSLMTIADLSRLLVETTVNQLDVARLKVNQPVKLTTESIKDTAMEAVIQFIAPVAVVKNNVKGFQVKALIEHPDPRLRPGMTVSIAIPIASATDTVSVPVSAVFRGENNSKIVYVRHGAVTERREVEVGVANYEFTEIKSGVEPGEQVLLVEPRVPQKPS
jgi:RND family efflux transporter MFP subunit